MSADGEAHRAVRRALGRELHVSQEASLLVTRAAELFVRLLAEQAQLQSDDGVVSYSAVGAL